MKTRIELVDEQPRPAIRRMMRRTQRGLRDIVREEYQRASEAKIPFDEAASAVMTALTGLFVEQIASVSYTIGADPKSVLRTLHRALLSGLDQIATSPKVMGIKASRKLIEEALEKGTSIPTKDELEQAYNAATLSAAGGSIVIGDGNGDDTSFDPDALLREIIEGPAKPEPEAVEPKEASDGTE